MEDSLGPALPPGYVQSETTSSFTFGPALPKSVVPEGHSSSCRSVFLPRLQVVNYSDTDSDRSVKLTACGPALPPGFKETASLVKDSSLGTSALGRDHTHACGPTLPPGFQVANSLEADPGTSVIIQEHLDSCGPALPPRFQVAADILEADTGTSVIKQEHLDSCGPALPPGFQVAADILEADTGTSVIKQEHLDSCGPALPPGFQVANRLEANTVTSVVRQEHLDSCGPALPPGFQVAADILEADTGTSVIKQEHLGSCGPALPPGFQFANRLEADTVTSVVNEEYLDSCGPALPPGFKVENILETEPDLGTSTVDQEHPNSCGPSLPPGYKFANSSETDLGPCTSALDNVHCGPALPQWLCAVKSSVTHNLNVLGTVTAALDKALSQSCGPVLPPGFQAQNSCNTDNELPASVTPHPSLGPALPPEIPTAKTQSDKYPSSDQVVGPLKTSPKSLGPALPPGFKTTKSNTAYDLEQAVRPLNSKSCGPALPPGFRAAESFDNVFDQNLGESVQNCSSESLGPALPPGFQGADESAIDSGSDQDIPSPTSANHLIGPALPPGFPAHSDSDPNSSLETLLPAGPELPPGFSAANHSAADSKSLKVASTANSLNLSLGPALPPGFPAITASSDTKAKSDVIVQLQAGPVLPPGFQIVRDSDSDSNSKEAVTSATTPYQSCDPLQPIFQAPELEAVSKSNLIQESLTCGPALPPKFQAVEPSDTDSNSVQGNEALNSANQSIQKQVQAESTLAKETRTVSVSNGPALPPGFNFAINSEPQHTMSKSIGPPLPPGFKTTTDSEDSDFQIHAEPWSDDDNDASKQQSIGPSLPPNFSKVTECSPGSIGPALPPGFSKKRRPDVEKDIEETIGPALPPGFASDSNEKNSLKYVGPVLPGCRSSSGDTKPAIGPTLPPGFGENDIQEATDSFGPPIGHVLPQSLKPVIKKENKGVRRIGPVGPALPPGFLQQESSSDEDSEKDAVLASSFARVGPVGPALPPGFKILSPNEDNMSGGRTVGPAVPPGFRYVGGGGYEVDSDVVGPMPFERSASKLSAAEEFERRSKKMKDKLTGKDDEANTATTRESWMTELPSDELGKSLGLVQRKFTTGIGSSKGGDRSVWTDTPADKARKEKEGDRGNKRSAEAVYSGVSARDERMEQQIDSYNKTKRKESLMDMHSKKMKKKHEEEKDIPKERRPFSREEDLGTNKFDDAQRKSIIKKARGLDSRFSHGEQKFH